jgi:hypothetical protein
MKFLNFDIPKKRGPVSGLRSSCWALLLFTLACVSPHPSGIDYVDGEGSVTSDGLHQIAWEPFGATFVRPGARLQNYHQVIIDPVTLAYEKKPSPGRIAYNSIEPNYKLSARAQASMRTSFAEALERQLILSGRFEAASKRGEGVLRIRGHIFDIAIMAPPMADQPPDSSTIVANSGHMTLALDLVDSATGQTLLRVAERKAIRDERKFYVSDPVAQSGALREIFGRWARKLLLEIDQLSALGEIPYPGG